MLQASDIAKAVRFTLRTSTTCFVPEAQMASQASSLHKLVGWKVFVYQPAACLLCRARRQGETDSVGRMRPARRSWWSLRLRPAARAWSPAHDQGGSD